MSDEAARLPGSLMCFRAPMTAKFAFSLFLCLAGLSGCSRQPAPQLDQPRSSDKVTMRDITFRSPSLERAMTYRVFLPANLSTSQKLPVVYLLHGGGADFREWSNDSDVARFAENGLILVMPEGESSYYTNSVDRLKDRFEDYIVKDLIAEVETKFPVDPSRRAIVGVSMGGFGAIKLALKYPSLYRFVGALSPALDVPSRPFSIKRISQYRYHASIFGPWGSSTRKENDPFVLVRKADLNTMAYVYFTCGEQEGLLPSNRQFAAILKQNKFRFEFRAGPGGHDWNQWNRLLPDLFSSLSQHIQ